MMKYGKIYTVTYREFEDVQTTVTAKVVGSNIDIHQEPVTALKSVKGGRTFYVHDSEIIDFKEVV